MKIAVLDPASGIAGDMFIGALIDVGLDRAWLERLPATLGLAGRAPRNVCSSRVCSKDGAETGLRDGVEFCTEVS